MSSLELYIAGDLVDLESTKDLRLSFNRGLTDLQNPNVRKGDFSYTLKLPKNPNNNRIFRDKKNPHQIDKFNSPTDYSAELFYKGLEVLKGFFRLNSVKGSYSGNLYSNSISWADALSRLSLQDLDIKAPFNLAGGVNSIQSYMSLDSDSSNILFPLTAYHPFRNNIASADRFTINANTVFQYLDFPPGTYYLNLLKEAFRAIGWEASGDLWQVEAFKKLYLAYAGDEPYIFNNYQLHGVEAIGDRFSLPLIDVTPFYIGFAALLEGNIILVPGGSVGDGIVQIEATDTIVKNTDNSAYNSAGQGEYNITHSGDYNLKFTLNDFTVIKDFNNNSNTNDYQRVALFAIDDNLSPTDKVAAETAINNYFNLSNNEVDSELVPFFADFFTGYSNLEGTTFNTLLNWIIQNSLIGSGLALYSSLSIPAALPFIIESPPIPLLEGQKIKFYLGTFNSSIAPASFECMYVYDTLKIEVNNQFPTEIDIAKNLPDINLKDFVSSYLNLTNSFFITDSDRKVIEFLTFDNLHLDASQAYKWDKADIDLGELLPNNTNKELTLAYDIDNNDRLVAGSTFGNRTEFNNNVYSSGVKTITIPFSSTQYQNIIDSINGTAYLIPSIMSQEQFEQGVLLGERIYKGGYIPRLLQATEILDSGTPAEIDIDGQLTNILLTTFTGAPSHPSQQLLNTINLRFDEVVGEKESLFESYYLLYLQLLQRGYLLKQVGLVNTKDFREMQIETPIDFNNEIWYLFAIDSFNPLAPGQATVTLIKRG
jgi:hypothetical protein